MACYLSSDFLEKPMETRKLGNSDLQITPVGFGAGRLEDRVGSSHGASRMMRIQ